MLDFSIEPHFNINNEEVLKDLKEYSKTNKIFALEDDAYIIIENQQIKFYGNVCLFKNEDVIKIN